MSQDPYSTQGGTKDEAARQAVEVKDHAAAEAADVKDHAAAAVKDVAQTAGDEVKSVARDARGEIRGLVDSGLNEVHTQAGRGQRQVAEQLRNVVDELDGMISGSSRYGMATQAAQELADRGRGLAGWLENHEPRDAVDEVRRFAARNPWTFLAVAAGAGLLAGRFIRGLRDEGADEPARQARRAGGQRSMGAGYAPPTPAYEQGFQPDPAQRATDPASTGYGPGGTGYDAAAPGTGTLGSEYPTDPTGTGTTDRDLYGDPSTAPRGQDPFRGLGERE